jgi:hypothetical protein
MPAEIFGRKIGSIGFGLLGKPNPAFDGLY